MPTQIHFLNHDIEPVLDPPADLKCPICQGKPDVPVKLPCHETHIFCDDCINDWLSAPRVNTCPHCRTELFDLPTDENDFGSYLDVPFVQLVDDMLDDLRELEELAARLGVALPDPAQTQFDTPLQPQPHSTPPEDRGTVSQPRLPSIQAIEVQSSLEMAYVDPRIWGNTSRLPISSYCDFPDEMPRFERFVLEDHGAEILEIRLPDMAMFEFLGSQWRIDERERDRNRVTIYRGGHPERHQEYEHEQDRELHRCAERQAQRMAKKNSEKSMKRGNMRKGNMGKAMSRR